MINIYRIIFYIYTLYNISKIITEIRCVDFLSFLKFNGKIMKNPHSSNTLLSKKRKRLNIDPNNSLEYCKYIWNKKKLSIKINVSLNDNNISF